MHALPIRVAAIALILFGFVPLGVAAPLEPPPQESPKEQGLVHPEYDEQGFRNVLEITSAAVQTAQEQETKQREGWQQRSQDYRLAEMREKSALAEMNKLPPGTSPPRALRDRVAEATLGKEQARKTMMEAFHEYAKAKELAAGARDKYRQQEEALRQQQQLQKSADQAAPVVDPLGPEGARTWKHLATLDEVCTILHLTRAEQAAQARYDEFVLSAAPGTNTLDSPQFRAVEEAAERRKQVVDLVLQGRLRSGDTTTMEPRCSRCGLPLSLFNRACVGN